MPVTSVPSSSVVIQSSHSESGLLGLLPPLVWAVRAIPFPIFPDLQYCLGRPDLNRACMSTNCSVVSLTPFSRIASMIGSALPLRVLICVLDSHSGATSAGHQIRCLSRRRTGLACPAKLTRCSLSSASCRNGNGAMSAAGSRPNLAGTHSGWPMCSGWSCVGRRSVVHLRQDVAETPENGMLGLVGKYAAQCEGDVVAELESAGELDHSSGARSAGRRPASRSG
jgi:hypothetical protein